MKGRNEVNVQTKNYIDGYLIYGLRIGDDIDELNHNSNDEDFSIMTDHVLFTDAGDFLLRVEEEAGYKFGSLCCAIFNIYDYLLTRK